MLAELKTLYQDAEASLLDEYFTFLSFPSISADPSCRDAIHACASWVERFLQESGLSAKQIPTPVYPIVYAHWLHAGPDKPTVLLYGHYDVQPADPLDEWETPPFEPILRDGRVYARGAQDNKGQIFYSLAAIRALLKRDGSLPVNLKICIEGEEETKSRGLAAILPSLKEELSADILIAPDFDIVSLEKPAIMVGMRGITGMGITLQGSRTDLHSGMHGGIVYNPNHALVALLASLRDEKGRIAVPGFYDDIEELGPKERQQLDLGFDIAAYESSLGTKANGGEADFPPLESGVLRPTLEINGIGGGYAGPGIKTVIPAKAQAVLSCRLVPRQDPSKVFQSIESFLRARIPEGMQLTLTDFGGAPAVRSSPASPGNQALARVYEELFGKEARFALSGGSVPITSELAEVSGAEPVLMGMGLASDAIHAPNEHFDLARLKAGFLAVGRFLHALSTMR